MTIPRLLPLASLVLLSAAALAITPMSAAYALRASAECEVISDGNMWFAGVANLRHLVAYAVLAAVAVWAFGARRAWLAALVVLLVSGCVELEQMLFADGHCRLRDMLPNLLAIVVGVAVAALVARLSVRPRTIG